ncbi:MAG TPA: hypothetical protein GX726_02860 [Clostridiales bacterium]|nr:hypothetical protein [Clostridiales bacterium]
MIQREFTPKEKVLLVVLAVLILGLLYYLGAYRINKEGLEARNQRIANLQEEIKVESIKASRMKAMEKSLKLIESGEMSKTAQIPDFDNTQPLVRSLNNIAAASAKYNMTFGEVVSEDGLVRRPVNMAFEVNSYDTAVSVIRALANCEYRSLIKNLDISGKDKSLRQGPLMLRLEVVFFEFDKRPPAEGAGAAS